KGAKVETPAAAGVSTAAILEGRETPSQWSWTDSPEGLSLSFAEKWRIFRQKRGRGDVAIHAAPQVALPRAPHAAARLLLLRGVNVRKSGQS
ncbi:MAG: hypothetical protein LBF51_01970, partial [Zoogloeaceae bacterium]|nr:hypothetical protein [Zoogloeaceae bacterium]